MTKRKNRLIWLILVLVLCFPTFVSAANMGGVEVKIPLEVKLEEINGTAPDEEFTVTIEREDGSDELLPENTSLKIARNGKAEFGPIMYETPGDYTYIIKQEKGTDQYTTYDETVYKAIVAVRNVLDSDNNPTGELEASIVLNKDNSSEKPNNLEFNNEYNKPDPSSVKDDLPIVKEVIGDKPEKDSNFKFKLEALSTTAEGLTELPMPEESNGQVKEVVVMGPGEYEFGWITFEKPGTYRYEMSEVPMGDKNYKYDTSKYIVEYNISYDEDSNALTSVRTITKDGKTVEVVKFVNEYKKPSQPKPDNPITGDNSNIRMDFIILVIAFAGLILTFRYRKNIEAK